MQANVNRDADRAADVRLLVHSVAFGAVAMASVVGVVRLTAGWNAWSTSILVVAVFTALVLVFDVTLDISLRRSWPSVRSDLRRIRVLGARSGRS